jgi:HK97 gp10 family phage protein
MSIKTSVKVEGLKELVDAFRELPKATGKNVIKRILTKRAQPIERQAAAGAPKRTGKLKRSITISTKLSRRQKSTVRQDKSYVEIYIGPGQQPQAIMQEFGTFKDKPQPFMRPAWDQNKGVLLNDLKKDLWAEIERAAARLAKKKGGR